MPPIYLPTSERLERHLLEAMHTGADAATRDRLGLRCEAIGGALVSIAGNDPSIMLNRTIGLGLAEPAAPGRRRAFAEGERAHPAHGAAFIAPPAARPTAPTRAPRRSANERSRPRGRG